MSWYSGTMRILGSEGPPSARARILSTYPQLLSPQGGYCWIHDYPHFSTFDGYHYNWYGLCNYTLAQTNDSTDPSDPHTAVYITFRKCFRRRRAVGMPTCLSTVTFRENPYTIIQIDPLNATWVGVSGKKDSVGGGGRKGG
ncbi:hypothetical protein E2C01_076146 [Portunus trituberculatus]|uniref:VWFD domain-containing protein n=1 Tax=Portunus trituberculatus TaxID=210409 RepID=A0A5B7IH27_PORTR|nr:hypothetical protein [Portunus trituberculatus]